MPAFRLFLLTLVFLTGGTHAASHNDTPGFDRVGAANLRPASAQTVAQAAPGETHAGTAALLERRREMARRLVWLMLSAR